MPSRDYPRMLFHRTKEPVTVQNREEEDALGREWSRIIWPVSAIAAPDDAPPSPEPELFTADYAEAEPEEEPAPAAKPTQPVRAHNKPHARKKKG